MIRALLDTNVLVSGLSGISLPTSTPGTILRLWRRGVFELVISPSIQAEVETTLGKPYFRTRPSRTLMEETRRLIADFATIVVPIVDVAAHAPHPEDDLVLAAAVSAQVDYLVTGDKQFQRVGAYGGVAIVSPRAFLDLLEMYDE